MKSRKGRKSRARHGDKQGPSWSMLALPGDITMDILLRLPLKSIIQCRCVCRTWRSLVSDSYFSKLQRERARSILVLRSLPTDGVIKPAGLGDLGRFYMVELESGRNGVMKFNTKNNLPTFHVETVGSCNGLLCLFDIHSKKSFYLCNPITGEFARTPTRAKREKQNGKVMDVASAFGFSPETNSYVVLRITKKKITHPISTVRSDSEICVFGATNTWKSIGDISFPAHKKFFGVSLHGALHWIVEVDEYDDADLICVFEIDNEKIRPMSPPPGFRMDTTEMTLGVLRDCLSVCDSMTIDNLDIWVMKEYGVKESWTKEVVIAKNSLPFKLQDCFLKPILVSNDGEILISSDSNDLVLYDPRRKSFTNITIGRVGSGGFEVVSHAARLDSLGDIMKRNCLKHQYGKTA